MLKNPRKWRQREKKNGGKDVCRVILPEAAPGSLAAYRTQWE